MYVKELQDLQLNLNQNAIVIGIKKLSQQYVLLIVIAMDIENVDQITNVRELLDQMLTMDTDNAILTLIENKKVVDV
jgi:23S rRNA U2552 (ribose-2'-O)-methylase RlmE/FtsJ